LIGRDWPKADRRVSDGRQQRETFICAIR
jgi:hypothetical protein